jgi:3-O-methylgallate 3,4-dioxygenase
MAEIVLGVGTSHTPMLSTPWQKWTTSAERDRDNPKLLGRDGVFYDYPGLETKADGSAVAELAPDRWESRNAQAQAAIQKISEKLAQVKPDVLLIVGDDQAEMFPETDMPALAIYWGDTVPGFRPAREVQHVSNAHPSLDISAWGWYGSDDTAYPCDADLGKHLIESLVADGFDITSCRQAHQGRSIGHAYGFFQQRILKDNPIPMVPIFLNGYFSPNQPTAARSYAFGEAIRRAVGTWGASKRVAIAASGGLSHLVIDEELDARVIAALKGRDKESLTTIPEKHLKSGNGEIKNWIATAAATEHLELKWLEYVPAYRSPVGTGVGLGFAYWE